MELLVGHALARADEISNICDELKKHVDEAVRSVTAEAQMLEQRMEASLQKRVEQLEAQNAELSKAGGVLHEQLEAQNAKLAKLSKQNAELSEQLTKSDINIERGAWSPRGRRLDVVMCAGTLTLTKPLGEKMKLVLGGLGPVSSIVPPCSTRAPVDQQSALAVSPSNRPTRISSCPSRGVLSDQR